MYTQMFYPIDSQTLRLVYDEKELTNRSPKIPILRLCFLRLCRGCVLVAVS